MSQNLSKNSQRMSESVANKRQNATILALNDLIKQTLVEIRVLQSGQKRFQKVVAEERAIYESRGLTPLSKLTSKALYTKANILNVQFKNRIETCHKKIEDMKQEIVVEQNNIELQKQIDLLEKKLAEVQSAIEELKEQEKMSQTEGVASIHENVDLADSQDEMEQTLDDEQEQTVEDYDAEQQAEFEEIETEEVVEDDEEQESIEHNSQEYSEDGSHKNQGDEQDDGGQKGSGTQTLKIEDFDCELVAKYGVVDLTQHNCILTQKISENGEVNELVFFRLCKVVADFPSSITTLADAQIQLLSALTISAKVYGQQRTLSLLNYLFKLACYSMLTAKEQSIQAKNGLVQWHQKIKEMQDN